MKTIEDLFEEVSKAISHPHSSLTKHDKERAAQVFILFYDYLVEMQLGFVDEDCPSLLFADFASDILDSLATR